MVPLIVPQPPFNKYDEGISPALVFFSNFSSYSDSCHLYTKGLSQSPPFRLQPLVSYDQVFLPVMSTCRQTPSPEQSPDSHSTAMNSDQKPPTSTEFHQAEVEKKFSTIVNGPSAETKALYLVPLQDGWVRQVIHRRLGQKRTDIYYTAPDGTKLRSRPEILKYLQAKSITKYKEFNFTFSPKPLCGECSPYEVVRMSRPTSRNATPELHRKFSIKTPPTERVKEETKPIIDLNIQNTPPTERVIEESKPIVDQNIHNLSNYSSRIRPQLNTNQKLYCICSDVVRGQMIRCSNENCAFQLYHVGCVVLRDVPKNPRTWYCPICRDSDFSTMNPAYAIKPGQRII